MSTAGSYSGYNRTSFGLNIADSPVVYPTQHAFNSTVKGNKTVTCEIEFDCDLINDMMYTVGAINKEVGWYSNVYLDTVETTTNIKHTFYLYDFILPDQQVHGATTEIDADWQDKEYMQGINNDDLKCWGHSHVNMGTTPSAQDYSTIKYGTLTTGDYFISVIANKRGNIRCTVGTMTPSGYIMYEDVPWSIAVPTMTMDRKNEILEELRTRVRSIVFTSAKSTKSGNGKKPTDVSGKSGVNKPTISWKSNKSTSLERLEESQRAIIDARRDEGSISTDEFEPDTDESHAGESVADMYERHYGNYSYNR